MAALYCCRRSTSGPGQSYKRGVGLAAAADNTEYHSRGRRCDLCMTKVFAAADNTGYHSRDLRYDHYMTEVFAAADSTGYHSRGRRCDRCMTEVFAAADNTGYHSRGRRGCSAVGRKGLARRNICDRAGGGNRSSDAQTNNRCRRVRLTSVALAPRTSSPHARLVCIARTRFPKPGRRNVSHKFPLVRFVVFVA